MDRTLQPNNILTSRSLPNLPTLLHYFLSSKNISFAIFKMKSFTLSAALATLLATTTSAQNLANTVTLTTNPCPDNKYEAKEFQLTLNAVGVVMVGKSLAPFLPYSTLFTFHNLQLSHHNSASNLCSTHSHANPSHHRPPTPLRPHPKILPLLHLTHNLPSLPRQRRQRPRLRAIQRQQARHDKHDARHDQESVV